MTSPFFGSHADREKKHRIIELLDNESPPEKHVCCLKHVMSSLHPITSMYHQVHNEDQSTLVQNVKVEWPSSGKNTTLLYLNFIEIYMILGAVKRRRACGQYLPCKAKDCGKCRFCRDKPKFGGKGTLKQKCLSRRCQLLKTIGEVRISGKKTHIHT